MSAGGRTSWVTTTSTSGQAAHYRMNALTQELLRADEARLAGSVEERLREPERRPLAAVRGRGADKGVAGQGAVGHGLYPGAAEPKVVGRLRRSVGGPGSVPVAAPAAPASPAAPAALVALAALAMLVGLGETIARLEQNHCGRRHRSVPAKPLQRFSPALITGAARNLIRIRRFHWCLSR
jgi:hypothetical protein